MSIFHRVIYAIDFVDSALQMILKEDEAQEKLKSDDWWPTPHEALAAYKEKTQKELDTAKKTKVSDKS